MSKRKQVTCECRRYAFPHRRQEQCRDYLPAFVDPFEALRGTRHDMQYHIDRQRELAETVRGQG